MFPKMGFMGEFMLSTAFPGKHMVNDVLLCTARSPPPAEEERCSDWFLAFGLHECSFGSLSPVPRAGD